MQNEETGKNSKEYITDPNPQTSQYFRLSNGNFDGQKVVKKTFTHSHFTALGFKEAKFEDCVFNHSLFERCYFRKAMFERVSVVGCTFRDCRFDEAQFINCTLDYAEFFNSQITFRQLSNTLPATDNVLRALAMNLRVNAQERGLTEDCRKFLMIETHATEHHNFRKAFYWTDAYYRKYSRMDRAKGFLSWVGLKFNWILWGHGEAPAQVILSSAAVILIFAGLFFTWFQQDFSGIHDFSFYEFIGVSAGAFTTSGYGLVTGLTRLTRLLLTLESAIGLTMFGFFVAALYRRISRR